MELRPSSLFLPRLHLLPLTLILVFSTFSQSSPKMETEELSYCNSLRSFLDVLNETNGENANLSSWRDTNNCSAWKGFTPEPLTLNLSGFNLAGNLTSLSTKLPFPRIDLSHNNFFGNIPTKLYESGDLISLNLSHNAFSGSLAGAVSSLSLVKSLDVSFNDLSGGIPSSLGNCTKLELLLLQGNHLSGTIPRSLGNLENLQQLNLSSNNLSGWIPSPLGKLENLEQLDLSNNNLSGGIPSSLGNCTHLELLLLQGNDLSGTIPRSLENLENLKRLDLSNNNLSGQVPTLGIFNDSSSFVHHGNGNLCGGVGGLKLPPCSNGGKSSSHLRNILIIAIVASAFSLLLLSWVLFRCSSRGSKLKHRSLLGGRSRVTYTYLDLHEATKGFSSTNLIGSGSIGSVYRGFLEDERREVAIKVFKKEVGDPDRFLEESRYLMKIGRSNLVRIVATCVDVDGVGDPFVALVYELMPNGNLEMWLHKKVVSQALNFRKWNLSLYQRLNVAIDVASALAHLHLPSERAVSHCNLKPSNVLFAEDMTASLTDFGMHEIFATSDIVANSNGYISPECGLGRAPSPSGDVYSFGVLLLEMFTRKKPAKIHSRQGMGIHRYVQQRFALDLDGVVDPLLLSEETGGKLTDRSRGCINSVIKIALTCSNENPIDRMGIKNALQKLEQVKLSYLEIGSVGSSPHSCSGPSGSSDAMLS